MGGTEDEVLKALFSGYILGFGMTGLAYFVGAIYALSFAQIMLAEMAAGEAASFVMMVVSALDGNSSSVVQYEIMNMLYFMSGMFMYCGSLPKNDMTPSKNGWNCDVWNAGSQGGSTVSNSGIGGKITGYTKHGLEQAVGRDGGKGVLPEAILDTVRNPSRVVEQTGKLGKTYKYVSDKAVVVLNEDGKIVTTYAKGSQWTRGGGTK